MDFMFKGAMPLKSQNTSKESKSKGRYKLHLNEIYLETVGLVQGFTLKISNLS